MSSATSSASASATSSTSSLFSVGGADTAVGGAGAAPEPPARRPADLARLAAAMRVVLEELGEDPAREGLAKTPLRVAKALVSLTRGYDEVPRALVSDALFDVEPGASEAMVVVRDINVHSMCEHHMLPFFGTAAVAYLPSGRVVGLSKLARLVDCFARRLQVQERLTSQVAAAVDECVAARGVAVSLSCCHMCMAMRGVGKPGAVTTTFAYTGAFRENAALRVEFLLAAGVGGAGVGGAGVGGAGAGAGSGAAAAAAAAASGLDARASGVLGAAHDHHPDAE